MDASPTKILMVCLGNICRSPLAEGILRSKLPENHFIIDSAGTGGWHVGQSPDPRSIQVAQQNGIDISYQRARKFELADFDTFDIIYAMDTSNKKNLLQIAPQPQAAAKVKLILEYLPDNQSLDVPDPYFGNHKDFEFTFELLDKVCEIISKNLRHPNY